MKKNVSMKGLSFLFVLLTAVLFSCKDDNDAMFKSGREEFAGKNNIRIVFPQERDTINFRDTTSGVLMVLKENELLTDGYEVKDTVSFLSESRGDTCKVKREFRIVLKYKDFHISGSADRERNFGFDATAVLYLNNYGEKKTDTIPLKYMPSIGNIKGNKMFYMEEFPDSSYKEPYILVRYTGYKISY